jgi:hypothetical protein
VTTCRVCRAAIYQQTVFNKPAARWVHVHHDRDHEAEPPECTHCNDDPPKGHTCPSCNRVATP